MKLLHELATQVLLGSERRSPVLPQLSGVLGDFLLASCPPESDIEVRVLRYAGSLAVCANSGYVPAVAEDAAPEACPAADLSEVDAPALLSVLQQILVDGPNQLRREAFRRLAAKGCGLPPGLLPRALTLGQKTPALRESLLAVLGRRGQWLARMNPAWAYAVDGADSAVDLALWEHGSQEQRKLILKKLRKSDPDQARELLQEDFSQLGARERASLLEQLDSGLGPSDEDFLESMLSDRSKDVRQRAAGLLSRLPGSRYVTRMASRMSACIGQSRKMFRSVHTLEAPAQFGADWKKDGLEERRAKSESLGERAWWLYQIARALPLAWWSEATGLSPAELIKWAAGTDWSEAILRAWSEALTRQPEPSWAAAFLNHAHSLPRSLDIFQLLACLPARQREQHWWVILKGESQRHAKGLLLARLVEDFSRGPDLLSEAFSRRVLAEVRKLIGHNHLYEVSQALPALVCLIPPACFDDAAESWPTGRLESEYYSKAIARILAIIEQRKILHQILR